MKQNVARIVLVDDHVLYRESLRGLFDRWTEFEVVGEATSGAEAVELCEQLEPDLVLMDISMPGMSGLESTETIVGGHSSTRVVMLSAEISEEKVASAFQCGASGYLLKNIHGYQLRSRLNDVLQGDVVLSGDVVDLCLDVLRAERGQKPGADHVSDAVSSLSAQEREILKYVAFGDSNKEIGERLFISESTVKKRFSVILAKLGLENRVQAAVFALHAGLADRA